MTLREKMHFFLSCREQLHKEALLVKSPLDARARIPASKAEIIFEDSAAISSPILGAGLLFVGCNSYCNDGGYIRTDQGGIFIGRYSSIGRRVSIGAGTHNLSGLSTSPALRGIKARPYTTEELLLVRANKKSTPTIIGNDVWIGDGVVVTSGVTIGSGCIIGSNAVVTRDTEPYQIYAGTPARIIGSRFDKSLADQLIRTEWWEVGLSDLNTLPLSNIIEFLACERPSPASLPSYRVSTEQE